MDKKKCPGCTIKPLENFAKNKRKKDGLQTYCRDCKKSMDASRYSRRTEYHKQYVKDQKKIRRDKTIKYLGKYLDNHPCVDCGEDDVRVLEFDHVRGEKTEGIAQMLAWGWSWNKIDEEIQKCDVRCANCHRKRTYSSLGWRSTWVGSSEAEQRSLKA